MIEQLTLSKITELCRLMQEGDRVRVLKFCEAIHQARSGKRQARAARHASHNKGLTAISQREELQ